MVSWLIVTGGRTLNPKNIAWLQPDLDGSMYWVGWDFFRHTAWGWPLGINPRYGAEVSSGITYIDNVPLCGLLFKALGPVLPEPFQYFGIWGIACFALYGWFAWLLVGLISERIAERALGTLLFLFAPTFLVRLDIYVQMQAQWLILAALYICLGPRRLSRNAAWPVLAFVSGLIHVYITAMVLGLWVSDWLRRVIYERPTRADFIQLLLVPSLVLLGLWQSGLFLVGHGMTKHGFGEYRMNVFSLIDPSGWSYFLKDIPEGKGDYEGFNFLGVGWLLLALAALPRVRYAGETLRKREYWPLLALCVGLLLFSVSNKIGIADHTFEIPLSEEWVARANILRTAGRMFWPVVYTLLFVVLRAVFKAYPPRVVLPLVAVAALLQTVDTSAGWLPIRAHLMLSGSTWTSPMKAPFWSQVPSNYRQFRFFPVRNKPENYADFAYFALNHGMDTDGVNFARIDEDKVRRANGLGARAVKQGKYEPDVLYVIDKREERAARRGPRAEADLLDRIDGFLVLAPGWKCRKQCRVPDQPRPEDCLPTCAVN
jgi:hypothetical protein